MAAKSADVPSVPLLAEPNAKIAIPNVEAFARFPLIVPAIVVQDQASYESATMIDNYVATIANGNADQVDWTPLHGRDVYIWPTPDDKHQRDAAILARDLFGKAKSVSVIAGRSETLAGASGDLIPLAVAELIQKHAKPVLAPQPRPAPKPKPKISRSVPLSWAELELECDPGKPPHVNLVNASKILQRDPNYAGRIWLDTFRDKIYFREGDRSRLWTDADTRSVTAYIQQHLKIHKVATMLMHEAVQHVAEANGANSLTDWLDTIKWDGVPRLHDWLTDTLGVEKNEYTMAIAHNWPIAMVARAYQPGCKFDHMPVLEGQQGLAKTSFLEVLGGEWYKSLPMAFGDKDFLQCIQGAWLVEIPDMTGFSRREHGAILATITIRVDEYRKSYGRMAESPPRVAIFAATSETDNYLKDTRGRRRYWPLRCQDINLHYLHEQRANIFAEALVAYRRGEPYWQMPGSADDEQLARSEPDPWAPDIVDKAEELWLKGMGNDKRANITAGRLLSELGMPIKDQNQETRQRVGSILKQNGWLNRHTKNARLWFKRG